MPSREATDHRLLRRARSVRLFTAAARRRHALFDRDALAAFGKVGFGVKCVEARHLPLHHVPQILRAIGILGEHRAFEAQLGKIMDRELDGWFSPGADVRMIAPGGRANHIAALPVDAVLFAIDTVVIDYRITLALHPVVDSDVIVAMEILALAGQQGLERDADAGRGAGRAGDIIVDQCDSSALIGMAPVFIIVESEGASDVLAGPFSGPCIRLNQSSDERVEVNNLAPVEAVLAVPFHFASPFCPRQAAQVESWDGMKPGGSTEAIVTHAPPC